MLDLRLSGCECALGLHSTFTLLSLLPRALFLHIILEPLLLASFRVQLGQDRRLDLPPLISPLLFLFSFLSSHKVAMHVAKHSSSQSRLVLYIK